MMIAQALHNSKKKKSADETKPFKEISSGFNLMLFTDLPVPSLFVVIPDVLVRSFTLNKGDKRFGRKY